MNTEKAWSNYAFCLYVQIRLDTQKESCFLIQENFLTVFPVKPYVPGENMSGLKRISKQVLLMEPTALHAFRTTSRLLASVVSEIQAEDYIKTPTGQLTSPTCHTGNTGSHAVSTVDEHQIGLQSPHYFLFSPKHPRAFFPVSLKNKKL